MKGRILILAAICTLTLTVLFNQQVSAANGQWSSSGTQIYYTAGPVRVGTGSSSRSMFTASAKGSSNKYGLAVYSDSAGRNTEFVTSNFHYANNIGASLTYSFYENRDMTIQAKKEGKSKYSHIILQPAGGRVGIGTKHPQEKLSVNGTILAKEVLVTTSSAYWPDYVFAEDYNLMSLGDLSQYIEKNNHLPGIPSAQEIGDSVGLGEMQRLQMEKIEELTLYILELEQELNLVKQSIK